MRNIEKHPVCDGDSYFSHLPDEIVLLILNKILDLKTLCRYKLVSTQFNRMVHQVDTISFVVSRADNPSYDLNPSADDVGNPKKLLHFLSKPFYNPLFGLTGEHCDPASYECESFWSAIQSLSKFTRLKSLCVELPSTRQDVVDNGSYLYKWKVKFGSKVEWLVFLSPNSVCDMKGSISNVDGNGQDEEQDGTDHFSVEKSFLAISCLMDAGVRFRMLLGCTLDFPLLEKVCIMQSGKRGSVSISGRDIVEMRNSLEQELTNSMDLCAGLYWSYVPLLKLPVSGYLMKEVTLFMFRSKDLLDGDKSFMNINLDDFEDKEEAAYGEAMMEMLKKLRSQI